MPEDGFAFERSEVEEFDENGQLVDVFYIVNHHAVDNALRGPLANKVYKEAALEHLDHAQDVLRGIVSERYGLNDDNDRPDSPPPATDVLDFG